MNKVILVGNGFDLAHGLPTSYKDFIEFYLKNLLKNIRDNNKLCSDEFLEMVFVTHRSGTQDEILDFLKKASIEDLIIFINGSFGASEKFRQRAADIGSAFKCYRKNSLFCDCISNYKNFNWGGIEQEYYKKLVDIAKGAGVGLDELNKSLDDITALLSKYLREELPLANSMEFISRAISSPFERSHFLNEHKPDSDKVDDVMIINFNYTDTARQLYCSAGDASVIPSIRVIDIHGNLNAIDNPVIFGFGDEMDEDYRILERKNDNRFLNHIKSVNYQRNNNYKNLINYLHLAPFQVVNMGHSFGLSDRVMLNMIFEHENCKSILLYHYRWGDNYEDTNYKTLVQNLSRHFNDNRKMRELVVSFDYHNSLPQA